MITALRTAIWNEGLDPTTGQHEALLAAAALALAETGPGKLSFDSALGMRSSGSAWMLAALGAAAAGSALTVWQGRSHPAETAPSPEAARP